MSAEIAFLDQIKKRAALPHASLWFDHPEKWVWRGRAGQVQGLGLIAQHEPGLANMLWLACDLSAVPTDYELTDNQLTTMLLLYGRSMRLDGLALYDQAGSLSLRQFRKAAQSTPFTAPPPVHNLAPLFVLLANGRLGYENP